MTLEAGSSLHTSAVFQPVFNMEMICFTTLLPEEHQISFTDWLKLMRHILRINSKGTKEKNMPRISKPRGKHSCWCLQ